jgi:hypothetical protein
MDELERLKSILQPPAYKPTEQEHMIAYQKHTLNYIFHDVLLGIHMCREGEWLAHTDKKWREEKIEQRLAMLDDIFKRWEDNGNKDIWEAEWDYEEFKKNWTEYLAEEHCGDCVQICCTCPRCSAEDLYGIPNTVTWKHNDGADMYHRYGQLWKEQRRWELAEESNKGE